MLDDRRDDRILPPAAFSAPDTTIVVLEPTAWPRDEPSGTWPKKEALAASPRRGVDDDRATGGRRMLAAASSCRVDVSGV